MCREALSNAVSNTAIRKFSNSVSSISNKCLFLCVVALLTVTVGCTSNGTSRSTYALNPLRVTRSHSRSTESEVSASHKSNRRNTESAPQEEPKIQLVADQEETSLDTIESSQAQKQSASVLTATEVAPDSSLTLAQLEALALQNNPTLTQAQSAISAEQGIFRQAGLYPNPQIGYINESASIPGVKQANGGYFAQEIVTSKKLQLAQNSASVEIKRYQWDHESQRMRVLNDLKIRFFEVLGAQQSLAVANQLVEIAEKAMAMVEKRKIAKSLNYSETEWLQTKIQLETVLLNRDEAENRYLNAWERLATMVGVPRMEPVPLEGDLAIDIPQLDMEACLQQLLACSPQIRSAECDLAHAWATYREARAQATPNMTVQTVSEYDQVTKAATVSALVAMPLQITNRNQGNIDKSYADIIAAQAEIARVTLVLRENFAESFHLYKNSLKQTERLQRIIESSKRNLDLTQSVYESGEVAITQVLEAQKSCFQSQTAYVGALADVHKYAAEIQGLQLTGGLNPASIGSAIQNQPGGGAQRQRALLNDVQDKASRQVQAAAQIGR